MSTAAKRRKPITTSPGVIEPGALYRLDELQARLRLGSWGLRQMRRAGLIVYRVSGRGYVLGSDAIEFIVSHGRGVTDCESEGGGQHRSEQM